jgi:hypothetical protein
MNPKMVGGTLHPGPLPIGFADSAEAEREKRSQRLGDMSALGWRRFMGREQVQMEQGLPMNPPALRATTSNENVVLLISNDLRGHFRGNRKRRATPCSGRAMLGAPVQGFTVRMVRGNLSWGRWGRCTHIW